MDLNFFFQKLVEEEVQSVANQAKQQAPMELQLFVKLRQQARCTPDRHQDISFFVACCHLASCT